MSAAFHSKIMKTAEKEMKSYLNMANFSDSIYPVISNFNALPNKNKSIIFEQLSKQMSNKVKWMDSIKVLESNKEKNIIEIGPGRVLTNLIKRISKSFNHYNINKPEDIEVFKNAI